MKQTKKQLLEQIKVLEERCQTQTTRKDEYYGELVKVSQELGRHKLVMASVRAAAGLEGEDGVSLVKHVRYLRDVAKWRTNGELP